MYTLCKNIKFFFPVIWINLNFVWLDFINSNYWLFCLSFQLSWSISDLAEMDFITSIREGNLTESLLSQNYSIFVNESR